MIDERKETVLRVLALRRKIVEMCGYTAGVEGLSTAEDLPDEFWERAEKHYHALLDEEGLVDDVTDDEIQQLGLAL